MAKTAAAPVAVEVISTPRGRIPPIYMPDGVADAGLIALWFSVPRAIDGNEGRAEVPGRAHR